LPVRHMRKLLLAAGVLALVGCLDVAGPKVSDPTKETFATSLGVNISQMQKTQSGTYFQDLTVGTGTALTSPQISTQVTVDYKGYLRDGTVFDSASAAKFSLGQVIFGFVDGIVNMKTGGERLIVIPSEFGYGNTTQ